LADLKEARMRRDTPRIVIVGVCASGKTVLANTLRQHGYNARSMAQEHSFVPGMWRAHGQPNVLICLDAGPATINARLGRNDFDEAMVAEQRCRLADARAYCDLHLPTDDLTEAQVQERVLAFLREGWPLDADSGTDTRVEAPPWRGRQRSSAVKKGSRRP
jgi:hypothetical protein